MTEIMKETARDPVLADVLQNTQKGWPESSNNKGIKPFWSKQAELSTQQGCLLWDSHVVVPPSLRSRILKELHDTHPGVSCMMSLGCMFVRWPGFDQQVEEIVHGSDLYERSCAAPPAAPLHPRVWPFWPWARLHCDYAGPFLGHRFLVVMDAHSKWLEVFPMTSTTATSTVEKLRVLFAQFRLPETLVTDNGTNFVSAEFAEFTRQNDIHHATSAPAHPSSKHAMKTFKEGISQMQSGSILDCLSCFLFAYRNPLTLLLKHLQPSF